MKRILYIFIFLCALVQLTQSATTSISSSATVVEGISISLIQSLNFGSLVAPKSSGYVDVTADGESVTTDRVQRVSNNSASLCLALFDVTGRENCSYNISLPQNVAINNASKGATMSVTNFNYITLNAGLGTPNLGNSGVDLLLIGARLVIESNQDSGDYTGSFSVTVSYE